MHRSRRLPALIMLLLAGMALFARAGRAQGPAVVLNEILVGNAGTNLDPDYTNFSGWIELRNLTGSSINLMNYRLSSLPDGATTPQVYTLPKGVSVPANGRILIWADEQKKGNHASFELDMDGGSLSLLAPGGAVLDQVLLDEQAPDVSYGRSPDGSGAWAYFDQPTPGAANSTPAFAGRTIAAMPTFSVPGGPKTGPLTVSLAAAAGATIRYTTDGSRPTETSPLYTDPIAINTTTLLRARAWVPGQMVSPTATQSYLLGIPVNLPVISLVTDPANLFDNKIGIYVKGTNGVAGCRTTANWHQRWERPASFEFYETSGQNRVNQEVGIEISGNCTRNLPQKSFEIKARKLYGDNDMDYAFFAGDKPMTAYKRLILRNSGQDNGRALMRDALAQNLAAGRMDLDRQAYRPAVVYVNGQYWGLYDVREKIDEDYVENNYALGEDQFDMLEQNYRVLNGSDDAFRDFYNYVRTNNPANAAVYAEIGNRMDIDSFIDYFILETYIANTDWPRNNTRWWDDHAATYGWRWVLRDLDYAFLERNIDRDMINWALKGKGPTAFIFKRLWTNPDFRDAFAQRYAAHLNTTFQPARITGFIDAMAGGIRDEVPAHIARWDSPASVSAWENEVQQLRNLVAVRHPLAREHLRKRIGNPADATLTTHVQGDGAVLVAGVEVPDGYSAPHFRNVPITLTAVPVPGQLFAYWLETGETSPTITIPFGGDTTRTAVFDEEPPPPPPPPVVINELHHTPPTADNTYEFLELYNAGSSPVDLSGYTIVGVDAPSPFPPGSSIAPGEYIVVADTPATYSGNGYQVFNFDGGLSSSGEEITLKDTLGRVVDTVTYGVTAPWPSTPNAGGPSLSLLDPALDNSLAANWAASRQNGGSPGAENFPPLPPVPPVIINEIHYNSVLTSTVPVEFIELYNNGSDPVALENFTLEGVAYTFPATTLNPGDYLVIASDSTGQPTWQQWTSGDLDDAGETITLRDPDGQVVDTVTYDDEAPWPAAADGAGPSLALGRVDLDNSLPANWGASREDGGTPGAENFPPLPLVINELHHTPPTADNTYEFLEIYNAGSSPVDLSGYTIVGVDPPSGATSPFPSGSTIAPGEYVVVADTPTTYSGNGYQVFDFNGGLSSSGEPITLKDPFGNTVDTVTYGVAAPWPSAPNAGGPSLSLLDPALDNSLAASWAASTLVGGTPGAANFPALSLVINELHYNPVLTPTVGIEFIELVNTGPAAVYLAGFTLEGVEYTFAADTLPVGGYLVIAAPGHSYPGALTWTSGDLNDEGETITLKDPFGGTVDSVTYDDDGVDWPLEPDGGGPSLSLDDPTLDNSLATNWSPSAADGGTPGAANFPP